MKVLFNNTIVSCALGIILTILLWGMFVLGGDTHNVGILASFTSMIILLIKEVVNAFMISEKWNLPVLLHGVVGSVLGGLITTFLF